MTSSHLSAGPQALHRGVYELTLTAPGLPPNPYADVELRVTFTRPDGTQVGVDGFYDGVTPARAAIYKARAYCDTPGTWHWRSQARVHAQPSLRALDARSGAFEVVPHNFAMQGVTSQQILGGTGIQAAWYLAPHALAGFYA